MSENQAMIPIKGDIYDEATLRLSCASAILRTLSIYQDNEGADMATPSQSLISQSLHGVASMIEDALGMMEGHSPTK